MNSKNINFIYNEAMTDAIRRTDCKGCKEVLMSSDEAKVIVKEYVDNTIDFDVVNSILDQERARFNGFISKIKTLPKRHKD